MGNKDRVASTELFEPAILRKNLILGSIFIAAFELLNDSIVERIRSFYALGSGESSVQADVQYRNDVLSRNRSPVYASLDWLKESGAVDINDIGSFDQAKKLRNMIAHEMHRIVLMGLPPEWPKRFENMVSLLDKIEKWWIINLDIPANSDFDGVEIKENEIMPGPILILKLMFDVALEAVDEPIH